MSQPELDPVSVLAALAEEVVGRDGLEIAALYFGEGYTLSELADWFGTSRSSLQRRLTRLWRRLEAHNALPPAWTRPSPGKKRIREFPTSATMYAGRAERGR